MHAQTEPGLSCGWVQTKTIQHPNDDPAERVSDCAISVIKANRSAVTAQRCDIGNTKAKVLSHGHF